MIAAPLPVDFTEARFAVLVERASSRFRFSGIGDARRDPAMSIWRHDIDFSPHRALATARIEAARGVRAVYFALVDSPFYSILEVQVRDVLRSIVGLGHEVALHYDAAALAGPRDAHEDRIRYQASLLGHEIGAEILSFSLHNPTVSGGVLLDDLDVGGLHNATSPALRSRFTYCSDSNGRWRHRSLLDVIEDIATTRLYALTHAEWWTPEPMSIEAKVARCIEGRARRVAESHWALIARHRPEEVTRG